MLSYLEIFLSDPIQGLFIQHHGPAGPYESVIQGLINFLFNEKILFKIKNYF